MMTEILGTIKELSETAIKKADENYKAITLRLSHAALKKLLEGQYKELGKAVYAMCKGGEEDAEEIAAMTVQIDRMRKRLAAIERRIDDISGVVKCPNCGKSLKMKYAYCAHCGKRLAAEVEEVHENENEMNIPEEIFEQDNFTV